MAENDAMKQVMDDVIEVSKAHIVDRPQELVTACLQNAIVGARKVFKMSRAEFLDLVNVGWDEVDVEMRKMRGDG
jgi:hypothetical protein